MVSVIINNKVNKYMFLTLEWFVNLQGHRFKKARKMLTLQHKIALFSLSTLSPMQSLKNMHEFNYTLLHI